MKRLTIIRHTCMGVALAGLLATGASAQNSDPDCVDRNHDQRDINHDRRDLRRDRHGV